MLNDFNVTMRGHGEQKILFGNGFGTGSSVWDSVIEALGQDYTAITYDLAGISAHTIGQFSKSRHSTLYGFAEDLLGIIDSLQKRPLIYVGHSVSGIIGILAALADPDCFSRMILIGSNAKYLADPEKGYVGAFSQQELANMITAMTTNYSAWANGFSIAAMANPELPDLAVEFYESIKAIRPDIAIKVLSTILGSDCREEVGIFRNLDIPTAIVQSKDDLAVPREAAHWLAENAAAKSYLEVDVKGHFPHMVKPRLIAEIIDRFVSENEF